MNEQWEMHYLPSHINTFVQQFFFLFVFFAKASSFVLWFVCFFNLFIFIFCCAGVSLLCKGFSLVAESGGFSLVVVGRLFVMVASLVELRL